MGMSQQKNSETYQNCGKDRKKMGKIEKIQKVIAIMRKKGIGLKKN